MHRIFFVVAMCCLLFQSCRTKKQTVAETSTLSTGSVTNVSLIEKQTLKPVYVAPDSAMVLAQLKCDSLNNVLLVELSQKGSAGTSTAVTLKNGLFKADYKTKHDTLYVPSTDRTLLITNEHWRYYDINKTKTVKVNELYWWQTWLMWIGGVLGLGVLLYLSSKLGWGRVSFRPKE